VSLFAPVDIALLLSEWSYGGAIQMCPVCDAMQKSGGHESACEMDLALGERAFATQEERDRAREMIRAAADDTLPPPAVESQP
jgi:hypothetical protein